MRKAIVFIGIVTMLVGGCVTPLIPLPPPEPARMSLTIQTGPYTQAYFNYDAHPSLAGAFFFVFNRSTGKGVIQQAAMDGSLTTSQTIVVNDKDHISVWVKRAASEERSNIVRMIVDLSQPRNLREPNPGE